MQSMVWLRTYSDECIVGLNNLKQTSSFFYWAELNGTEVISVVGLWKMEVQFPAQRQDSYTKVQMLPVNKGDGEYTSFALRPFHLHNSLIGRL